MPFYFIGFRKEAGLVMDGKFIIRNIYNDAATYDVVGAASKVLGTSVCPFVCLCVCLCWRSTITHLKCFIMIYLY